ncbi:conserved hypothetical protein [Xenorhabdus nematophila F1]|uniref:Uncharacterized protein n=1 Tax=Xenorhabdus nematophila (strain ATCC 19061 / DSM 3370 / CCUG 14189 / LMG 1036 / NCIMB 9965 / AN6) TaxID=406817 RepID=D3VFI7_XENNA|nr:hypothetical protein XNC1_2242 [Xenorhabdus nematophila ATCC 19061]CCW32311.1 conserved hypothetical protein [Xenorhabdus nematophila F1]
MVINRIYNDSTKLSRACIDERTFYLLVEAQPGRLATPSGHSCAKNFVKNIASK